MTGEGVGAVVGVMTTGNVGESPDGRVDRELLKRWRTCRLGCAATSASFCEPHPRTLQGTDHEDQQTDPTVGPSTGHSWALTGRRSA